MSDTIIPKTFKDILRPLIPRSILNARNAYKDRQALEYLSSRSHIPFFPGSNPVGINLYGDDNAGTGLSRSVQLLRNAFDAVSLPYNFYHIEEWSGRALYDLAKVPFPKYMVNVFHLQPSVWLSFMKQAEEWILDHYYNIAFWLWETPEFPEEWYPVIRFFDEIWVPSAFIASALRKVTDKPVKVMYYGIGDELPEEDPHQTGAASSEWKAARSPARVRLGIPQDAMLCLILYDGRSSIVRKNPYGALKAFCKAFPKMPEDVWLVIKGKFFSKAEKRKMERMLKGRPRVVWVEGLLPREEVQELLQTTDVLLSLHRAEGFGLPVAEVMQYGGVVVATDYSSTTEFLDESCGCPVGYRLYRIRRDISLYHKGTIWADPDILDAARQLQRIYWDPQRRRRLGEAAAARIREKFDVVASGNRMADRIHKICRS